MKRTGKKEIFQIGIRKKIWKKKLPKAVWRKRQNFPCTRIRKERNRKGRRTMNRNTRRNLPAGQKKDILLYKLPLGI